MWHTERCEGNVVGVFKEGQFLESNMHYYGDYKDTSYSYTDTAGQCTNSYTDTAG